MKQFFLKSIRFYQRYLSPDTGIVKHLYLVGSACRFRPTCSEYMYQAINRYGIMKGIHLGLRRMLHCHPWNAGGYDPVP